MEIHATHLLTTPVQSDPLRAQPEADPTQVEAFTRALFSQTDKTPELHALEHLQTQTQQVNQVLVSAHQPTAELHNPSAMLAMQEKMMNTVIDLDFAAKTAGVLAQGVNKLVSMS
ncbi:type III secretion protein SsaI [bacterium endosymbiont of Mortierella elongata FMR23-6]|nr:type III secretion protein SsaI [bacterium endosymbiont of Mortierella elongata FMR23-6]